MDFFGDRRWTAVDQRRNSDQQKNSTCGNSHGDQLNASCGAKRELKRLFTIGKPNILSGEIKQCDKLHDMCFLID